MEKKIKELGYGVAIHYNEYVKVFEVYKIGTYFPSDSSKGLEQQVVSVNKSLNKAIEEFKELTK